MTEIQSAVTSFCSKVRAAGIYEINHCEVESLYWAGMNSISINAPFRAMAESLHRKEKEFKKAASESGLPGFVIILSQGQHCGPPIKI